MISTILLTEVLNMKQSGRILSFLLLLCMLAAVFASCGAPAENAQTTAAAGSEGGPEVTEADVFQDVDFGGEEFNYLVWEQTVDEYTVEDATGDLIQTAIFNRNLQVQEKLGVNFVYRQEKGNSSSFNNFCAIVDRNIKGGDEPFDAMACYTRAASQLMIKGSLANLNTNTYLNFSNAWWPQSLTELNTVRDNLYFASGDIATSLLYQMMFMIINDDLASDLHIEGVQEEALKGNWTVDKMIEVSKGVYADLSGGTAPHGIDNQYGLHAMGHPLLDIFYMGAGLNYVEMDADGNPMISEEFTGEAAFDLSDKLKQLFWSGDNSDGFFTAKSDYTKVQNGTSLLYVINGEILQQQMSQATYKYSILCAPKYNLDQKNYCTAVGFPFSMYCIPVNAPDEDMSGAVLELMARESYKQVTPKVFDTAFKYKYSNGDGDVKMLDIIRDGVVFDFGRTLFDQLGGDETSPIRLWRNDVMNNTNVISSSQKSYLDSWKLKLDRYMSSMP